MSTVFSRATQGLAADRGRGSRWGVLLAAALLGVWGAWFCLARLTVYAVTDTARLEVERAVYPIETPVDGRVVATHLALGREVQGGEVLVELEAEPQRLQREEERTRLAALTHQLEALRVEVATDRPGIDRVTAGGAGGARRSPAPSSRKPWPGRSSLLRRPHARRACTPGASWRSWTSCGCRPKRSGGRPPPTACGWALTGCSGSSGRGRVTAKRSSNGCKREITQPRRATHNRRSDAGAAGARDGAAPHPRAGGRTTRGSGHLCKSARSSRQGTSSVLSCPPAASGSWRSSSPRWPWDGCRPGSRPACASTASPGRSMAAWRRR